MNAHTYVNHGRMTSKGQVLIPKRIRDAAGLVPGGSITVALNDRGEAVVIPAPDGASDEERRRAYLTQLARVAEILCAHDRYPAMSTDEYMAMVREPIQPFEHDVPE